MVLLSPAWFCESLLLLSAEDDGIHHYLITVQEMESYSTEFRRRLKELYYESVIEHDRRLQLIQRTNPPVDFETLCNLDKKVAIKDYTAKSYPIAIYLNKLAPKLKPLTRKVVIYDRREPVGSLGTYPAEKRGRKLAQSDLDLPETIGADILKGTQINPRQSWFKLYDRSPPFPLIHRSLYESIQTRTRLSKTKSDGCQTLLENSQERYVKFYKNRIYCRDTLNQQNENRSSSLIWNRPNQSESIDPLS